MRVVLSILVILVLSVVLVSDALIPGISDHGHELSGINKELLSHETVDTEPIGEPVVDTGNLSEPQVPLFFSQPATPVARVSLRVIKHQRVLEITGDNVLIGRFAIALGRVPDQDKEVEGDYKTPMGQFFLCTRNEQSSFTRFMGISYPNSEDAQRGLDSGLIDALTAEQIRQAEQAKTVPPWNTPLGGEVGLHGGGIGHDWTWGCIALSDEAIIKLWELCPNGTPIEILP